MGMYRAAQTTTARVNYPQERARETAGVNHESSSDLCRAMQIRATEDCLMQLFVECTYFEINF